MSTPASSSALVDYAELDCLSNFSFLTGASHPGELVQRAAELGYCALALADDCSLAGVVRAHIATKKLKDAGFLNFRLIVGSRFFLNCQAKTPMQIIVLARNAKGYGNLSEFITMVRTSARRGKGPHASPLRGSLPPEGASFALGTARQQKGPHASPLRGSLPPEGASFALGRPDEQKHKYSLCAQDIHHPEPQYEHLRDLPDCLAIYIPGYGIGLDEMLRQIDSLLPAFSGRLWVGSSLHYRHDDASHAATLNHAAQVRGLAVVATGQVQMHKRSRQPLHDIITAIRQHKTVQQCGYALNGNAEHHLRSRARLMQIHPRNALQETLRVSQLCRFNLDEITYQYPTEVVPTGLSASAYLRQETFAGGRRRYPQGIPTQVKAQLESELAIIAGLNYESYFLTVYDIVLFARKQAILCQGRGSAANSAVCYCLGITEVNPEDGNSLFARFISTERNEPPDIDVDFEHQRREEVIQYIYRKYGRQRAALTAVVITYRIRSALRDTGKALGLDPVLIVRVADSFQHWDGQQLFLEKMTTQGLDPNARVVQAWAQLTQTLIGFPRHLSQHPGGFVISRGTLSRLVPIENAAMPERSVVQWDKDDLDAMGLMKVDVLALGMLSALRRMLNLVGQRKSQPFALQDIPEDDEATFKMIRQADTIGVFQIESRAQMSMLPRLQPRSFYDLVIQIAIVRPGPIHGDMVHPYLRRRQGLEPVSYPSDQIKQILERTLGIPIFQEQVMQIAITAAGFTPGEADELRRSMAAWKRKGNVDLLRPKLIAGMLARDYPNDFIQAIYRQLEGFGEYGFPESHSASFAKLAYFSAWFKRYEPQAFLAALLNSQPMGFYSASQLVQDARRHGVVVLPVDITASGWETSLAPAPENPPENVLARHRNKQTSNASGLNSKTGFDSNDSSIKGKRPAVRLGLHLVGGLAQEAALRIEAARQNQPFSSTHDLALRALLSRHDMDALAGANALQPLSGHRRQALWQAANMPLKGLLHEALICDAVQPQLHPPSEQGQIKADYQAMGLSLRRHPLALLRPTLQERRFVCASVLHNDYPHKRLARVCGIVTTRQRPQTAKGVVFVSLEDETGLVNIIVRPELAERQRHELLHSRLMGVYGVWQRQNSVCHLVASRLVDLTPLLEGLPTRSRNFH